MSAVSVYYLIKWFALVFIGWSDAVGKELVCASSSSGIHCGRLLVSHVDSRKRLTFYVLCFMAHRALWWSGEMGAALLTRTWWSAGCSHGPHHVLHLCLRQVRRGWPVGWLGSPPLCVCWVFESGDVLRGPGCRGQKQIEIQAGLSMEQRQIWSVCFFLLFPTC